MSKKFQETQLKHNNRLREINLIFVMDVNVFIKIERRPKVHVYGLKVTKVDKGLSDDVKEMHVINY